MQTGRIDPGADSTRRKPVKNNQPETSVGKPWDLIAGRKRAKELLELDDEEVKRQMLRDIRRNPPPGSAIPGDDEGLFSRVYRWKTAVCKGPPGMFKAVANTRRELGRAVPNLFLAGDYTRVPLVNGALASGISAAEETVALFASPAAES